MKLTTITRVALVLVVALLATFAAAAVVGAKTGHVSPDLTGPWGGHFNGGGHGTIDVTIVQTGSTGTIVFEAYEKKGSHIHGDGTFTQTGRKVAGTIFITGDVPDDTLTVKGKSNWKGSILVLTMRTSEGKQVHVQLHRY